MAGWAAFPVAHAAVGQVDLFLHLRRVGWVLCRLLVRAGLGREPVSQRSDPELQPIVEHDPLVVWPGARLVRSPSGRGW